MMRTDATIRSVGVQASACRTSVDPRQANACTPTRASSVACLLASWLIVGSVNVAFGQLFEDAEADEGAATRSLQASASLDAAGDAVALDTEPLQAVAQSLVIVTLQSEGDKNDFKPTVTGVIVPPREGEAAAGWVVIPYPYSWFKRESVRKLTDEFRNDQSKWDAWWKSKLDGSPVKGADWQSTANYIDAQPLLNLVLLQLAEPDRSRPALALNMEPKHEHQPVIVHQADPRRRQAARLTIGFPNDTHPWQIELTDLSQGAELDPGSAVTDLSGQLLGIVSRIKVDKKIALAGRDGPDNMYRMIPARYAEAMVALQHPAVSENLVNLIIGVAMGKERALVDERDAVSEGRGKRQTPADQAKAQSPEVPGPQAGGGYAGALNGDEDAPPAGAGRFGAGFGGGFGAYDPRSMLPGTGMGGVRRALGGAEAPAESREMKVFTLQHLSTSEATMVLQELLSGSVTSSAVPGQKTIIVNGPADAIKIVQALLRVLDEEPGADAKPGEPLSIGVPEMSGAGTRSSMPGMGIGFGGADAPKMEIKLFRLQHMHPANAVTALSPLFPGVPSPNFGFVAPAVPPPTFVAVPSQRTLIVRGLADDLQKIAALLQVLDVPDAEPAAGTESTADATAEEEKPLPSNSFSMNSAADIEALRTAYAEHDARARKYAEPIRKQIRSGFRQDTGKEEKALRAAVREAFDARQKLQQAELAALEQRLVSLRRTLAAREKIKEQIIQRRLEELLNPALEWETSDIRKQSRAIDGNTSIVKSDWPVPFRHVIRRGDASGSATEIPQSSSKSPDVSTERLFRGKTESEWQQNFSLETEPVAKLDAGIALLNLAAQSPPAEVFERILQVGEEIVRLKYSDEPWAFAFESLPPHRWSIGGEEQRKAYLAFYRDIEQIVTALPKALVAEQLAAAIGGASPPRAAFSFWLLTYAARMPIAADPEASRLLYENLSRSPPGGGDASIQVLLARIQMADAATDLEIDGLARDVIEASQRLRSMQTSAPQLEDSIRDWLVSFNPYSSRLLQRPDVTRALAELLLDDVVRRGRAATNLVGAQPLTINPSFPGGIQAAIADARQGYGPALRSWVTVANEYLEQHQTAPYSAADRTVCKGLLRAASLYSDGDDWPVERTAEILTAQLRAAYTDDESLSDQPVGELVPALPWSMLAQIVAITGEIPDFIGTLKPKSKPLADRLATLDRLLARQVPKVRVYAELDSLDGLLGDAPVETIRRLVTNANGEGAFATIELGDSVERRLSSLLEQRSSLGPQGPPETTGHAGFFPGGPTPTRQAIDPLLLLAIFNDLTGVTDEQDRTIAALFSLGLLDNIFSEKIKLLQASQCQSRRHAARMLREMAEKTNSPALREQILYIDPAAVAAGPPAAAEN